MDQKPKPEIPTPIPTGSSGISSNSPGGIRIVSAEVFDELSKKVTAQNTALVTTNTLVLGVIIVLFIALIGLLIDAWRFNGNNYQAIRTKIDEVVSSQRDRETEQLTKANNYLVDELKRSRDQYDDLAKELEEAKLSLETLKINVAQSKRELAELKKKMNL
jgi:septal ring factor EnvC (AmiA/AmiB activator)